MAATDDFATLITGITAGQVLDLCVTRIHSTTTTATNICAWW